MAIAFPYEGRRRKHEKLPCGIALIRRMVAFRVRNVGKMDPHGQEKCHFTVSSRIMPALIPK